MASALGLTLPYLFAPRRSTESNSARGVPHDDSSAWQADLAAIKVGDTAAFDRIVLHFDDLLRRFAVRMIDAHDADDVVQDVFVWLWDHRTTLPEQTNLRAYLYMATRNRALRHLRHARVEYESEVRFALDVERAAMGESSVPFDLQLEQAELANAVERALMALSPRVRQVALLRWQDGLKRNEIAQVLAVSTATVKNQLATAIQILRPLVKRYAGDTGGGVSEPE